MSSHEHYDESIMKPEMKTEERDISVASEGPNSEFLALQRRAIWKIDLIVIPLLTMFYLLSFLDRANIGNARVAVFHTLHVNSFNLIIKKIGPHRLLPGIVFLWGLVTALQGLVHNYSGLIATRFFLGLTEGGLLPGIVLYMSAFYRRDQLQLRLAMLFSATSLAGAFSGLLAAAIIKLDAPHVILLCIPLFFSGVTLFGLAFFTPSIVNSLGYSPVRTQLMTVPPYAVSFVVSLSLAYVSDRYKMRGPVLFVTGVIATAGYAIYLAYASAPTLSAWMANNAQPYYRRATAIALAFVFSNLGGIVSTWIFTNPPRYTVATRSNLAFAIGLCVFAVIIDIYFILQNRRKAAILASPDYGKNGEDSTEEQKRLGDRHPKFMYIL
ncbi:major facilitator superfamily transporter [Ceratobasidium sp. AG-Ba]|nr:major facilitator superfamily transporter [Ceratobasidium sp. AG-Ba]